jgi:hypothetical protein
VIIKEVAMRSALYFPHTTVDNVNLVRTALLLWDKLEYIVPEHRFSSVHGSRLVQRAMEVIGKERVPNNAEKQEAHRLIEQMASSALPPEFYLTRRGRSHGVYEMYPQKFLTETWQLLRKRGLSGDLLENSDYPMAEPAGLMAMAILADCCAGTTRARVTDRGPAYASLAGALGTDINQRMRVRRTSQEQLVHISLNVINPKGISLERLIEFREREEKESGHTLRDLRHRYLAGLETHVKRLTTEGGKREDAQQIKREIADDMRADLAALKSEFGSAKRDVWLSKEIVLTVLAAAGSVATWAFGAPIPIAGTITAAGMPAALVGIGATANKYVAARRAVMQKHPMAYFYELSR